ncbi:hypothetical protein BGZ65_002346 [Modicella reniformis]|uniref:AD domain-containing protein n=1 Tax=Modicella reniformis TaxID=1440133 RepID=A0A9P6MIH5_9FUNG|nr:hypothetical protein BGZ65_002346 [Modicella reniformis]
MAEEWRFFGFTLQDIHSKLGSPCVATLVGSEYSGYLYNIDPETYTVFILQRLCQGQGQGQDQGQGLTQEQVAHGDNIETNVKENHEAWDIVVVRQHALKGFEFQNDSEPDNLSVEEMDSIARVPHALIDPAKIKARKEGLVAMLRSKRIPVETSAEDAVVHIMNSAHVHPPYLPLSVECANGVMLERVRSMIQELHEE